MAKIGWQKHRISVMNGEKVSRQREALGQIVTETWDRAVAVPYVVSMPEKKRLLMLVTVDYPHRPAVMWSDDEGATWSEPQKIIQETPGSENPEHCIGVSLTYLGGGTLWMSVESFGRYCSEDYGVTWGEPVAREGMSEGGSWYQWDPYLVDKDAQTGKVVRLAETGWNCHAGSPEGTGYYAEIRFSYDQGWHWDKPITVPQWEGIDEVALCRAANGTIVAACRTENPPEYRHDMDHYGGLQISLSRDNGLTWSQPQTLYRWGRHHPSMVVLPDGRLVMSYVVRQGYPDAADGTPQFGIEAVVSEDNGEGWNLDGRIVLAQWKGNRIGPVAWWASCQATSTLLLPDGHLLTAYGTGYRSEPNAINMPSPRDIGLVKWTLEN